ncbi:uncharacterized protein LOC143551612 [Bidens hawaiensis]|uniref:uncharacterized protein LOC143551612 n=1 Tax=Bidens hawaiensis TaxID=980011 RepID=UPI00404934D5
MNVNQAQSSSDVVNGKFHIDNHYAPVLSDTGADKSFISLNFAYIINKPRDKLSKHFSIEVASGNSIIIDSVIRDCVITLNKFKFCIDLIPMQMGSFDVILAMDWLTLNRAEVVCFEKFLRILLKNGRVIKDFGDTPTSKFNLMSGFQAQCYLRKKYIAFVALVVEKERKEKKTSDILIMRNFPDNVSDLPLVRQIEFRIDLIPEANLVAKPLTILHPPKCKNFQANYKNSRTRVLFSQVLLLGVHLFVLSRRKMLT